MAVIVAGLSLLIVLCCLFPVALILRDTKGTAMNPTTRDTLIRALRTFAQAFVGTLAAMLVPFLYNLVQAAGEADGRIVAIDVNFLGNVLIAAVVAGIIALIALAQNLLEDKTPVQLLPK